MPNQQPRIIGIILGLILPQSSRLADVVIIYWWSSKIVGAGTKPLFLGQPKLIILADATYKSIII